MVGVVPTDIRAETADSRLAITWNDGKSSSLPFVFLRGECQCARCVDEITGRRLLDVSTIPDDICVDNMELRGNYAVRIVWSDGHDTGLFTWEFLRELGERAS
ncbi:MAG: DUF971 domain-containing protein [Pirellulales bacterium]|nr:DUF971 domain-containing protein [Pirellulales bacterium]